MARYVRVQLQGFDFLHMAQVRHLDNRVGGCAGREDASPSYAPLTIGGLGGAWVLNGT